MFLLVSGRFSIQISINLDDTLLRIACELKAAETWFLARLFILQLSIISQILEFIYWTVTIFSFDHMTDENREKYTSQLCPKHGFFIAAFEQPYIILFIANQQTMKLVIGKHQDFVT